jgi:dolichyl-phosphate-mannose-protein mannosyltransferase
MECPSWWPMARVCHRATAAVTAMGVRRRWLRIVVPAILVGAAAVLMVGGVSQPDRIVFDEIYYVNDARDFLEFGVEQGFVVHPPFGKMLIAFSIWLFGDTPFGWRALGGVAGAGTVLLTYLIGRRLFQRIAPAALAALLLAVDGVLIVQARTAMLDVYLGFFVSLGAWALVAHVQRAREADEAWLAADPNPKDRLPHRDVTMLVVAGMALGLATAVKWSGLLGVGAAGLVMVGAELARRRRVFGTPWKRLGRATALTAATLLAIPAATYVVGWAPWFVDYENSYEAEQSCDEPRSSSCAATPLPAKVGELVEFHGRIARFHEGLEAEHKYRAPAYAWPLLARPVLFYYETCGEDRYHRVPETETDDGQVTVEVPEPCVVERGEAAEMLALGNPALWWTFLPSAALLVAGLVRRDRRAAVPLAFCAVQFLPWLAVSRPVFSFYAVPMVPFLALGVAATVARIGDRLPLAAPLAGSTLGGAVAAGLVGLWDVLGGGPTKPAYGLMAAAGAAVGAAVVSWRTGPHADEDVAAADSPAWSRPATWVVVTLVVLAVGLALFFLPIWLGIPMDRDLVRSRWWFRGWI